jgi:hypothetical protein
VTKFGIAFDLHARGTLHLGNSARHVLRIKSVPAPIHDWVLSNIKSDWFIGHPNSKRKRRVDPRNSF